MKLIPPKLNFFSTLMKEELSPIKRFLDSHDTERDHWLTANCQGFKIQKKERERESRCILFLEGKLYIFNSRFEKKKKELC
jgi:hypothetical protein